MCILMFDDMSLQSGINYKKTGYIEGMEEDNAVKFADRGIQYSWLEAQQKMEAITCIFYCPKRNEHQGVIR